MREGIELIPWQKRFNDDAAEMLYQSYRQHVDALINDQYASVMGATRLIENIFHNQGCGDFLTRVRAWRCIAPRSSWRESLR